MTKFGQALGYLAAKSCLLLDKVISKERERERELWAIRFFEVQKYYLER